MIDFFFVTQNGDLLKITAENRRRATELLQELLDKRFGYDPESEVNEQYVVAHTYMVWVPIEPERSAK